MKKIVLFALLATVSSPALAEEMSPLQYYLYNESGYAPVAQAAPAQPETQYYAAYEPPPLDPDYTDSGDGNDALDSGEALRNMLISAGN